MNEQIITVKQIPVIEESLSALAAGIDERVALAMSMVVTEDTVPAVKTVRADLNKEFAQLEDMRKQVKAQVLAPYEQFEKVYKECVSGKFKAADESLKTRIAEVEDGLKAIKRQEAQTYFEAGAELRGLDFVAYHKMEQNITLSASAKKLREEIDAYLDKLMDDMNAIANMQYSNEVLAEYKLSLDLHQSIVHVNEIHRELEKMAEPVPELIYPEPTPEPVLQEPVQAAVPKAARLPRHFIIELSKSEVAELRDWLKSRGIPYVEGDVEL